MISVLNIRNIDRDIELVGNPDILLYCGRSSSFKNAQKLVPELVDASFFGNPNPMNYESARPRVIEQFRVKLWKEMRSSNGSRIKRGVERLAELDRQGKHVGLCCFCKPHDCHADVIKKAAEWVNKKQPK